MELVDGLDFADGGVGEEAGAHVGVPGDGARADVGVELGEVVRCVERHLCVFLVGRGWRSGELPADSSGRCAGVYPAWGAN